MKKAVAYIDSYMNEEKSKTGIENQGTFLIATVKGDVHDIGKNIVGVVLACNGYKVIDLGVMVSCAKILEEARKHNADLIGLSGLITPSLEEMISNAKEMERTGFKVPLLIGGATTSRVHTAVKIDPHYSGPVAHVTDASLVVEVCRQLTGSEKEKYFALTKQKSKETRENYLSKGSADLVSFAEAQKARFQFDWNSYKPPQPEKTGIFEFAVTLEELIPYIDWSPFFWSWELKGTYPQILSHPKYGEEAGKLHQDALALLKEALAEKRFSPRSLVGLFPAYSQGEDVHLYDEKTGKEFQSFYFLRQQRKKEAVSGTHYSLSDFVSPQKSAKDHLGLFVVTAGNNVEKWATECEKQHDDYKAILVKAVGDRIAEALAEWTHKKVRQIFDFGKKEDLTNQDLIAEKYQGIRPAPGYPACPDHTAKFDLWKLLDVEKRLGVKLTESAAMTPASSVSGFYFTHPQAKYFHVGQVGTDQLQDMSQRRNMSLEELEKWLAPYL